MDIRAVMTGNKPGDPQSQNLVNPAKFSETQHSAAFWKEIVLDILSVGFATLFGFLYYRYLTGDAGMVLFVFGALALYGVFSGLQAFLTKNFGRRFFIVLLEIAGLLGFFYRDDWHILLAIAGALLVFLLLGYSMSRRILENSIQIPFFHSSKATLGSFVTGILIFIILAYVPVIQGSRIVIPTDGFRAFFNWAAGVAQNFYPNVALNGSFSEFASSVSKMELANNPNFQSLNSQAQTTAIAQGAAQIAKNFSQNVGTPIVPAAPASDAFYGMVTGMLTAWQSQSPVWFTVGWAVALFFVLRGLGIIFMWIMQLLLLIVYEAFLASGFIKITEETQTKEIVAY